MPEIHHKIVNELIEEYGKDEHVIGIIIFGSIAEGVERPDSDVDITIVYDDGREWELFKEERYGTKIDLEIMDRKDIDMLLNEYPYLVNFDRDKIMIDKEEFLKDSFERLNNYYVKHPQVRKYWDDHRRKVREAKNKGEKPPGLMEAYDGAERRFSSYHRVKRKILTLEFFKKHKRK